MINFILTSFFERLVPTFGPNAMILRTHSTENIMVKAELRKISVLQ